MSDREKLVVREERCGQCGGRGRVRPESASPYFDMGYREPCPACSGTGIVTEKAA